jgi:hypothetical protein
MKRKIKLSEYKLQIEELQMKVAIYEGIITSQGQYQRGEALPWREAKVISDAQHKEKMIVEGINFNE